MKDKKIDSVFAIYSAGLVWVLYGILLPLYRITDLFIALGLSLIVYSVMKKFVCRADVKTLPVKFEKTGVAEADGIIKQGQSYIATLERQNLAIPDTRLSAQIDSLKESAVSIFAFVEKNPANTRQLNTFMEYYFPTAIKLLDSYIELQGKPKISTNDGNIAGTLSKIEEVMESIVVAFQKQLDVLYENKNLDVKTDIEVLKRILERENLA